MGMIEYRSWGVEIGAGWGKSVEVVTEESPEFWKCGNFYVLLIQTCKPVILLYIKVLCVFAIHVLRRLYKNRQISGKPLCKLKKNNNCWCMCIL